MNFLFNWWKGNTVPPAALPYHDGWNIPIRYPPLDPTNASIRLLKFEGIKSDDVLSYSLQTYLVRDRPSYTALSYAWGDAELNARMKEHVPKILVNDFETTVGINLYCFLSQGSFPSLLQLYCQKLIWVDALCINQEDEVEKASQVRMMGDVYSAAYNVCVWLGYKPTDDDGLPFDSVWSWRGPVYRPSHGTTKSNEYWKRMWVVQEVKCAKRLFFACGNRIATAEQFKSTLGSSAGRFWVFDKSLSKNRTSLADWITRLQHFECTDVRDKIFALNNLLPESQRIEVSYKFSIRDLYLLIMARQYGDIRNMKFEKMEWVNLNLFMFIFNIFDSWSYLSGIVPMPTKDVHHIGGSIVAVVKETFTLNSHPEIKTAWPRGKADTFAFSHPCPQPTVGKAEPSKPPPALDEILHISPTAGGHYNAVGTSVEQTYVSLGENGGSGFATAGVQHGDLLCRFDDSKRVRVVIRPLIYVPEDLEFDPPRSDMLRAVYPKFEGHEKFLSVGQKGRSETFAGIWLSYEIVGLALEADKTTNITAMPSLAPDEEPRSRTALYDRFMGLGIRLYLNRVRVAAMLDFVSTYDDDFDLVQNEYLLHQNSARISSRQQKGGNTNERPMDMSEVWLNQVKMKIMQSDSSAGREVRVEQGLPADYSEFKSLWSNTFGQSGASSPRSSSATYGSNRSGSSDGAEDDLSPVVSNCDETVKSSNV